MAWQFNPFSTPLLVAALLCTLIACFVWNRRPAPGAVALTVLMVATAGYSLTVAIGMASRDPGLAEACWRATFCTAVLIWPAWLVFAVEYTGQQVWLNRRNLLLLALPVVATLALVYTNDRHHLMNLGFLAIGPNGVAGFVWSPGPAFYAHLIFSDLCALAGSVLLISWAVHLPHSQRAPVVWLLSGAVAPLLGRLASLLGGIPVGYLDLSPFVLPLTGLAWAYGLLRYGLYGVVPVARESIFRRATEGMLALDILGRVADSNPAAESLLGTTVPARGRAIGTMLPGLPADVDLSLPVELEFSVTVGDGDGARIVEVHSTPVFSGNHHFSGHVMNLRDVTEVRRALEALDRANRQSSDILASISDGFFALDKDYAVTYFNKAAEAQLGRRAEDVLGRHVFEAFPELRDPELVQQYAAVMEARQPFSFERYFDCEPLRNWYDVRVYPTDQGTAVYFRVTTEQRLAAEALRASEEKFRGVVEQSQDGIVLADTDGRVIEWNAGQEAITGVAMGDAIGRPLWELQATLHVAAHDAASREELCLRAKEAYGEVLAGQWIAGPHEATIRRPDGRVRRMQSLIFHIVTSSGVLIGSVNRDVTEVREAERQREALYRIAQAATESTDLAQLFAVIHGAVAELIPARNFHIALFDRDSGLVSFPYLVDEMCPVALPRTDGRGRVEYIMRTGKPLLADGAALRRLVDAGEIEADGTMALSYVGVPLWGRSGVIGVMAAQSHGGESYTAPDRDLLMLISGQVAMAIERKRAEEALRRSEAQLSSLMNGMAAGVAIVQAGECRYANPAIEAMTCFTAAQLQGHGFWAAIDPADRPMLAERDADRLAGCAVSAQFELRVRRPDGERRWLAMVSTAIDFEGAPATLVSALDITDQKRLQEQVIASQKLSVLGTVAAGVAHEINSPLQVITGMTHTMAERLREGSVDRARIVHGLDLIERNGWRCADIVGSLLTYARPSAPQALPEDLNAIIRDGLLLMEHEVNSWASISVALRLAEHLPPLVCDHNQIVQVLINLLTNARDAMPDGGRITVATGQEQPGGRVTLQVEDTGVGMAESIRARVFDPFFTTKEPGKGTGLGLSIVSGIVRSCGGEIVVESAPGEGSRFTLLFPVTPAAEGGLVIAEEGGRYDVADDGTN